MSALSCEIVASTFLAPGIEGLEALKSQFSKADARLDPAWQAQPQCLSSRAAKRLSPQIRLALAVAERLAPDLPQEAAWVFASSIGEGETLQVILEALRTPAMMIQPLRFQNAVHNAASGQWTIAAGLRGPATSIGAYDETAGAGLLKAAMQCALENRPVGFVLYDVPLPEPLDAIHPLGVPMGAGFVLRPGRTVRLSQGAGTVTGPLSPIGRELVATLNPVAKILPLLERLCGLTSSDIALGLHGGSVLRVAL